MRIDLKKIGYVIRKISFEKKIFIVFLLSFFSFKITADNYPAEAVITNSVNFSVNVKTNVDCFTCDYLEQIKDTISVSLNSSNDKYMLEGSTFMIPVSLINCHNSIMNNDLKDMLNVSLYPHIYVQMHDLYIDKYDQKSGRGVLSISIDGYNNSYSVNFKNYIKNHYMIIKGDVLVDLNDFNISPPSKFFGLITVNKVIDINFGVMLKINNSS
jgi:hypothetical protein